MRVTNAPDAADRMQRWCTFYPVSEPFSAFTGDRPTVTVDLRPASGIVTWSVAWRRGDRTLSQARHSTFPGQFLEDDDLMLASGRRPPTFTGAGWARVAS